MATQHRAKKRFGQNFLSDPGIIQRIIQSINPKPGQRLIEIGPGLGALTCPILKIVGEMDVIELDRDIVPKLQLNCGLDYSTEKKLRIHNIDVLNFDFNSLTADQHLRLVGNLPYNISTPLLFHIFNHAHNIEDMHFMLQKEVVDRMAATPGSKRYGRLSIMTQYHCEVEPLFDVAPGSFNPPPKVKSSIVRLIPHAKKPVTVTDYLQFAHIVNQAFSLRRKTMRNALKTIISEQGLNDCDIDPTKRPETISLKEFATISDYISEHPEESE